LKSISKKCGVSVNDVMFSATAGALRFYLQKKFHEKQLDIQSVLWVSLRGTSLEGTPQMGNKIGAVYLKLPLKTDSPIERVQDVKQQTDIMRRSPEPIVARFIMQVFGYLPPIIAEHLWYQLAFKVTASVSNVPGPQYPLQFCGSNVHNFLFFVSPARNIGVFLCMLSYNGQVFFGLACDQRLIEEPREVLGYFKQELDQLNEAINLKSEKKETVTT